MNRSIMRVLTSALAIVLGLAALLTLTAPGTVEAFLRPAPIGIKAVDATATSMRLTWPRISSTPAYLVSYSTGASVDHHLSRTNEATLTGLRPGRSYVVKVQPANAEGAPIGNTATSTVRTLFANGFEFAAVTGITVHKVTKKAVKLGWKQAAGAPGYRIEIGTKPALAHPKVQFTRHPRAKLAGLAPGTTYFYRVSVARSAKPAAVLSAAKTKTVTTSADGYDLRIASYNICGSLNAAWEPRKWAVTRQLAGLYPTAQPSPALDAAVLQEANTSRHVAGGVTQYQDVINSMNALATGPAETRAHYAGIYSNTNATRIVYNDTTLTLVKSGVLDYSAQEMRVDGARLSPWAIFEVKATGQRFFLLSAHLETASERIRRAQWGQLIAAVPALSEGLPVVVGGDFNSPRKGRGNPTAAAMLGRMKAAGFGDTLGQTGPGSVTYASSRAEEIVNGNFNSVNRFSRHLNSYPGTTIGQDVDYIFASNDLPVLKWEMVLSRSGTTAIGPRASDHNMIRVTIRLGA